MRRDYSGEHVYLGIDVHKKTFAVTAIANSEVVKKDSMRAAPEDLIKYCGKFFPGAKIFSAYEAGFSGFGLHRKLVASGIANRVVHAAAIEIAANDRVKTDRRDSMKIATQLSNGQLRGIHIPSEEQEARRIVSRLRETVMRQRTRTGNQLKGFLYLRGLIEPECDRRICQKWIKELVAAPHPEETALGIQVFADTWMFLNGKIKELDKELEKQAANDPFLEKIYLSVPGVGPTATRVLANELGDMSQFRREKELFSYLGLTPTEYSSGENVRRGSISRQGKASLRKVLVQSAWVAVRHDPSLTEVFDRISQRAGKKRAIVAVARKLAGRIRACLRQGRKYQCS